MAAPLENTPGERVESDLSAPGRFGASLMVCRPSARSMAGLVFAGIVALGLVFWRLVATWSAVKKGEGGGRDYLLALVLTIGALPFLFLYLMIGLRISLHPAGIIKALRGKTKSCRWEDVSEVIERISGERTVTLTLVDRDGRRRLAMGAQLVKGFPTMRALIWEEAQERGIRWTTEVAAAK
jgi:hypothetical protein